jgi:putative SOS response-associated peptidase YedK
MCTLYNLRTTREEAASYFKTGENWRRDVEALGKDYVATNRPGYVVVESEGQRQLTTMKWGFPPPPNVRAPVVNVRNLTSPFWRTALSRPDRRCLVPATSFSEWTAIADPATGKKTLHWFDIPSRPIFAMAGIWRPTESMPAYAFLTCEPNTIVGAIHPKAMPVILAEDQFGDWLRGDFETVCRMAQPFPSQLMSMTA